MSLSGWTSRFLFCRSKGGSTLAAVERSRQEGFDVRGVVALVDREEGGKAAVEAAGIPLRALFRRSDFP